MFATGYRCQSLASGNTGTLEVGLLPLEANDTVPVIAQATWSDEAPKPGNQETITVTTTAPSADPNDAVRTVVVAATAATSYRALALTQVTAGPSSDGVTQVWEGKLLLPGATGTLIYAVVAATADCRASKVLRIPIVTSR